MFQQLILLGNVGKAPEIRYSQSGQAIAKFSLATSYSYFNNESQKITQTSWHRIVVFGPKATNVVEKYVKQGSLLMIRGRISYSEYEKDGHKQYMTQIVADDIKLMPKSGKNSEQSGEDQPEKPKQQNKAKPQSPPSDVPEDSWGNDMPSDMMEDNSNPTDDIPF
jgi:single-strand DNA-binding protein